MWFYVLRYIRISIYSLLTKLKIQCYYYLQNYHMGANCTTCISTKKPIRSSNYQFSNCPDDIAQYQPQVKPNLSKYKFDGLLYNIKLLNYPDAVSLKFGIPDVFQTRVPKKTKVSNSNQIKWQNKQNFQFIADEYQLRLKFLLVTINEESSKKSQTIKLNLYKIATGPYHNDLNIFGSKSNARLQFDFKISQLVEIKVDCQQAAAIIQKKEYPGQSFYFTIRILRQQKQQPFQSSPSYSHHKPYLQTKRTDMPAHLIDECVSPIKIRGKQPIKLTKNNSNFLWSKKKGQMPSFKIFLKSHEIQKTILHVIIWRNQNEVQQNSSQNTNDEDADMFCQSHTPILKILQRQQMAKNNELKLVKTQQNIIQFQKQGLWSDGEKIGELSMKIKVENNLFIKQMKACTRTQQGIIESVPYIPIFGNQNQNNTQKFYQVNQIMKKIYDLNKQRNQNKSLSNLNYQKLKNKMLQQFNKILKFYQNSQQSSFFVPNNQSQIVRLMNDQSQLLSMVSRIINFSEDDQQLTDICWRIILNIMRRGQFNLNNIGFYKNDQFQVKKNLKEKTKIALQFQQSLYKLLVLSLKIGYIQGRKNPRQSVQMFRAYCYLRVPFYREILLKKVSRKEDQTIGWNASITQDNVQDVPETQKIIATQLDWQNYFYKPLQREPKSQQLNKQLMQNVEESLWLQQISKRGNTFFYFLYFLILRLCDLNKKIKFIKWQYYPGYNKLIKAFIYEMKNIKVQHYPQSLIQTSIHLLSNERLLNILICVVFQKTNSNDCNGLMKSLDLISRYLNYFKKNKKLLPPIFNYVYFFKGLKIVIEGEFSFAIVKVFSIIFMNYQNFNVEFKRNLSLYLLGKVFFKLFLNWSHTIRNAFYHTLILKIHKSIDVFDPQSRRQFANKTQIMNQIKTRYDQCIRILKNALQVSKQKNNIQVLKKQQKQLFKILKRKILNRKKKVSNNFSERTDSQVKLIGKKSSEEKNNYFSDGKVKKNHSIFQLAKDNNNQRSQSMVIDPSLLVPNQQKYNMGDRQSCQDISLQKCKSSGIDENKSQQFINSNLKTPNKKLRQRKRSIFGNQDFDLKQLDTKQWLYLGIALKQYQNLNEAIQNYRILNNALPICQLDVQVPIDEKQIKPDSADFEQWQGGQEDDD